MVTWEIITLYLVNYNSTQIQMMGTHLQGPCHANIYSEKSHLF